MTRTEKRRAIRRCLKLSFSLSEIKKAIRYLLQREIDEAAEYARWGR